MTLVVVCLSLMLAQGQPRDARPATEGTAVVRGRVYSAITGSPIRGAMVSLVPVSGESMAGQQRVFPPPPGVRGSEPRLVATDDAGRFAFQGVSAGRYRLVATAGPHAGRYLPSGFAATRPNEAGRPIAVAAGQVIKDADIALATGSAIEGRVVDDLGEPVARLVVSAARLGFGSSVPEHVAVSPAQTDDLGRFRIFGLEAGDYIVFAEGRRSYRTGAVEGETHSFLTTYHPTSASALGAQVIRVPPSQDLLGIDIQLVRSRRYSLSGTIVNAHGQPPASALATLVQPTLGGHSSAHVSVDALGRFAVRDLDPGEYVLEVRASVPMTANKEIADKEFADVPVSLNGGDLDDLVIATQPGIAIGGRLVFVEGVPPDPLSITVSLHGVRAHQPPAAFEANCRVDADLRFAFSGVFGAKLLRFASLPPGWALRAVMLGGTDITDQPTVFRPEHDGQIQLVVTTRASMVEGVVTDEHGAATGDATVYVFAEDKTSWRMSSPRVHRAQVGDDGRFAVRGLTGGRYLAVAVSHEGFRPIQNAGEAFFAALQTAATSLVVGDDEKRAIELRAWRWPE
jgi:hypothetical protein